MIAALFVQTGGIYYGLPDVDPWDEARDARKYNGPYPVVAHPPCNRWGKMAPVNQVRYGQRIGDDGGCFAAALRAVRHFGGVLEHPAESLAWDAFDLTPPTSSGWIRAIIGFQGAHAWVCQVEQRHWGHRARKKTWLYAVLPPGVAPPAMHWGPGEVPEAWISTDRPRAELAALGIDQLSHEEAAATPIEFRDLLLSIARSTRGAAHTRAA